MLSEPRYASIEQAKIITETWGWSHTFQRGTTAAAGIRSPAVKGVESRRDLYSIENLYVPQPVLEAVMPYLDSIYADYKLYDSIRHKQYAGLSNERIKENFRLLLTSEKKEQVIIRTPMIPGITADSINIEQISRYISWLFKDVTNVYIS